MPNLCRTAVFAASLTLVGLYVAPASVFAQQGLIAVDAEVVSTGEKGRLKTLTVKAGEDELEILLTPKVDLQILATGDDGFLREGQFIKAKGIKSNDDLFCGSFVVYPGLTGRIPPAQATKAPAQAGASQNEWFVSGQIVGREPYEDGNYEILQLKVNAKNSLPIFAEKARTIQVNVEDLSLVEPGMPAKVRGTLSGRRFLAKEVTVTLSNVLKAEEYFANAEAE